ncbi:MAG: hypothetical protein ABFR36_02760 [Acidobacteriota bacterium]
MKRNGYFLFSLIFFILIGYSQFVYDSNTDYFKKKNTFLALPSGKTIKIFTFGNSELAADLLYIWSIQFFSDYNLLNSKDFIEDIYNLITDISPGYMDPYLMGSTIMAIELNEIEMAIRLLQKGSENLPEEWIFDFESGYYTSKYLKDYKKSEIFYKRASAKDGAPKFISRMLFHSVYMQGKLEESWDLWQSVLQGAETEIERRSANLHLYQIKVEFDKRIIRKALDKFKIRYGFFPDKINELVIYGFIREIPRDLKGNYYQYDKEKGTIDPKEGYMWKK